MIADDSVIALANRCPHLRSLGLYFCKNITDRAMYSLAQSKVNNRMWGSSVKGGRGDDGDEGLRTLNISQCTALTPSAVQAVCDSFPSLHTCSGRHSLIMSGCLNLTSVHCACAVHAHRAFTNFPHPAHWKRRHTSRKCPSLWRAQRSVNGGVDMCVGAANELSSHMLFESFRLCTTSWNLCFYIIPGLWTLWMQQELACY